MKSKYIHALYSFFDRQIVLSRIACVGKEIFSLKSGEWGRVELINQQKLRLDLFLDLLENKRPYANAQMIREYVYREDVYPLIEEQGQLRWINYKGKNIKCFMLDTFSELTDQMFVHKKEQWAFCCHYTDLNAQGGFHDIFESKGLLEINRFEAVYRKFLDWYEVSFPRTTLVFIHYSAKFDSRNEFNERVMQLRTVTKALAEEKHYVLNVDIDDLYYYKNEFDDFPYHYSKRTYREMIKKWKGIEK